jgi:protoheme IX farnesyltransferase
MNDILQPVFSRSGWRELWALTKPKVVQLIVFCAFIGMLLSLDSWPDAQHWYTIIIASAGIWCVASAAAVMNCVLEKRIDARMQRTAWRATARDALNDWHIVLFAAILCIAGCWMLVVYINLLTMWLTLATLVGYAGIYTVILKPRTSQNIVIGGASGAMPPVLGWAAIQGTLGLEPWLLFLIIFIWTPPHFWALAMYRVEDYRRSGLPMLPVTHGMRYTGCHIFLYTIALLVISVAPVVFGYFSWLYLIVAVVTGCVFCWYGYGLWQRYSDLLARQTFRWSLLHLSLLFIAMLADHYLF